MQVAEVPLNDVVVKFRLRSPSDEKVTEIAESISQIGLLNPITLDENNNLLAGYHRYLAYQRLERSHIPSIIKKVDKRFGELCEIDENLKRHNLCYLQEANHISRREQLLEELGLTYTRGDNIHTFTEEKVGVEDLAEGLGLSKRSYQKRKQISKIHPEVRDHLVDTEWSNSLNDLVRLSSEEDHIQKLICKMLISGRCKTWKSAFFNAKLDNFKLERSDVPDFLAKERWGEFPKSIMKFNRVDDDLRKVCNLVNHDDDLRLEKGSLRFGETKIRLHQMNPDQCKFSLDYYTNPGDLICDPFNGRGTTAITSLHLNRKFIGFEINPISSKMTKEVIESHMDVSQDEYQIIDGCGCEMKELEDKSEILDGVFSSPPYYRNAESYSDDPKDLCNMGVEAFNERIDLMFKNLSRLIKRSNYKEKIFHPVIMVVGTARDAENGILDMSYEFQRIAKDHGFTLWDQMFVELNNPFLVCSIRRNHEFRFVQKSYESQLCWVKF